MGMAAPVEMVLIEDGHFEDFFCTRFQIAHGSDGISRMEFIDDRPDGPVRVKRCTIPNSGYVRSAIEAAFACVRCPQRVISRMN